MKNSRVPVLIVTLSRYEHLVRCVESLKRNKLAIETELYIGLDFPPSEKYTEGYNRINQYLSKLVGFKKVHVIRHSVNVGCGKNHWIVRNEIYKKFDCYIFSEDDNEFSENYLEYMNLLMETYKDAPDIVAISGYGYPLFHQYKENQVFYIDTYFSAYGCGIWKDKWEKLESGIQLDNFKKYYFDKKKMMQLRRRSPNQFCYFVKGMIGYVSELRDDSKLAFMDLSYGIYMYFNDLKMIFPTITKVKNWGFDGTGLHCDMYRTTQKEKVDTYHDYNFVEQELDSATEFKQIKCMEEFSQESVDELLRQYFRISKRELWLSIMAYFLSCVTGVDIMYKFVRKIKKGR